MEPKKVKLPDGTTEYHYELNTDNVAEAGPIIGEMLAAAVLGEGQAMMRAVEEAAEGLEVGQHRLLASRPIVAAVRKVTSEQIWVAISLPVPVASKTDPAVPAGHVFTQPMRMTGAAIEANAPARDICEAIATQIGDDKIRDWWMSEASVIDETIPFARIHGVKAAADEVRKLWAKRPAAK